MHVEFTNIGGFCSVLYDPGWGSPEDLEEKVTTQSHIRCSSYLQSFTDGRKAQSLPFKLLGLRRELIFTLAYRPVCSSRGMLICLRTVRLAGGKTHFTLRGERTSECSQKRNRLQTQTQHAGVRLIYIKGRRHEQTSASTP